MKKSRKLLAILLTVALALSSAACSGGGGSQASGESSGTPESSQAQTESSQASESSTAESSAEEAPAADMTSYPREESLYYAPGQWGAPVSNNPLASNPNYAAMSQSDMARELVWETLYMWNPSDETAYPLLADGEYQWNEDQTAITVKLKEAAHWSDGTPLTAADVEATWDAHVNYQSNTGIAYSPYIADVVAIDDHTVEFQANTDNLNRMKMLEYLPKVYVMQKAYLEELDAQHGGDLQAGNFDITLTSFSGGISGAYTVFYSYMYGFGGEFAEAMTTNYGRYYNEEADQLLMELSNELDETRQKEIYQRLNEIYLTDVPSFAVMYRPYVFHSVYEGVWTNFPSENDSTDPKIPPMICTDGYGIAALYNLELVNG